MEHEEIKTQLDVKKNKILYYMKSPFLESYLKNWKRDTFVFLLIWIFLSSIQINILEKDKVFSIFHGFLIASLVSIS